MAWVMAARDSYPFNLEWLESNSLVEVHRLLTGQSLYVAPSSSYIPDEYPPVYFVVSAGLVAVSHLPALFCLRLVSATSTAVSLGLLFVLVARETGEWKAGLVSARLYAAAYPITGYFYDLARVDSLCLALSLTAIYLVRWHPSRAGSTGAAVAEVVAILTKQTALALLPALGLYLLAGPSRRRAGWWFLGLTGGLLAALIITLAMASRGWSSFYVLALLAEQPLQASQISLFWTRELGPAVALVTVAGVTVAGAADPVPRTLNSRLTSSGHRLPQWIASPAGLMAMTAAAFLSGSWLSEIHSGGYANVLMPSLAASALIGGLIAGTCLRSARNSHRGLSTGDSSQRTHRLPTAARCAVASLALVAQLAYLATRWDPSGQIPTNADRRIGWAVVTALSALPGPIYLPSDPGLLLDAHKSPSAHQAAASDVLRAHGDGPAKSDLKASLEKAVEYQKFNYLVIEQAGDLEGLPSNFGHLYLRCPGLLLQGAPNDAFYAPTDLRLRPRYLYVADGRATCQSAAALDRVSPPPR